MTKKITIPKNVLEQFSPEEKVDDISLKFTISDNRSHLNFDLTALNNETVQRRLDLKKFKDFLINTPRRLKTKEVLFNVYKQIIKEIGNEFNSNLNLNKTINKFYISLLNRVKNKSLAITSYEHYRVQSRIIFTECYGFDDKEFIKLFPNYTQRTGKIDNPTILDSFGNEKAFSKEQFKEIARIFLNLNYFCENLIDNYEKKSVVFEYRDIYKLEIHPRYTDLLDFKNINTCSLMISFMCLTGLNFTPLMTMQRSNIVIDRERKLISFKAICNRKKKEQLHNYPMRDNQLKFFEKIINNSVKLSPNEDILFPYISKEYKIEFFEKNFYNLYRLFNKGFCGDYKGITINSRKFRHSYGSQFNEIDLRSVALFNSVKTAAKHYSTGNAEENNSQLQNAMNIYTIALSNNEDIQVVKENISKINIVNIKDIQSLKQENSQITSSGIFCINSKEGKESEKFARRMENLKLENIESINCASILACFNCKNSILVNDFENIYLLLSFYDYLNNIVHESNTSSLFSDENAVKNALVSISIVLETKIDKKILNKVKKYIDKNGNHPLWDLNGEFI